MGVTMGNDRSQLLLRGLVGGALAGIALCLSGPWWMVPALALLWSVVQSPLAAALWGGVAVAISHHWLLALHPLTWLGVPALLSLPLAMAVWLACALAAALLVCAWTLLGRSLPGGGGVWHAVVLALVWGLTETLLARGPLFWIGVGGSVLPADPWFAGLARWVGAGGLAAALVLFGWWLWTVLTVAGTDARVRWRLLSAGVLGLLVAHGLGAAALIGNGVRGAPVATSQLPVALWQPVIPTREKFSDQRQAELPVRLSDAMARAADGGAQLMMAPEGLLPLQPKSIAEGPIPLLSGGFRWVAGQQRSALLFFDPESSATPAAIDKHRLVPLGEWTPSLPGLVGLSAVGGLQSGDPSRLWRWGGPPAAVAICYEISNGTALARAVANGGEWILAAANLDPYPMLLQRQFLALAQLRSVETARPLLSVANTGPTALVTARGGVGAKLPAMRPGLLQTALNPQTSRDGYVLWREWPLWLMLSTALAALLRTRAGSGLPPAQPRRRKTPPPGRE